MNLFYQPLLSTGVLHLDADESRHCARVLRKRPGDEIHLTDGKGFFYTARLIRTDDKQCTFEILNTEEVPKAGWSTHIAISPTKNADRIEWFVEKAVEIGIDTITLLMCDHTERTYIKTERLEKVAIGAMKQSLKARLPLIHPPTDFAEVIQRTEASQKFIAYVDHHNPHHLKNVATPGHDYILLIGPEGDFSSEELNTALTQGYQKVSLGRHRLRTETAGLAACHILNLLND